MLFVLFVLSLLWGCAARNNEYSGNITPRDIYQRGYEDYQNEDYREAIESFRKLKEEYPISRFAIPAELGIADSNFGMENYAEAESDYRDFIDLHPTNENIPYVIYQVGMCHYNQMLGVDRDQTETIRAKEEFERLISRFPSSKFSFMAERRLRDCRKKLGEHEFYVGYFYFKIEKYEAALKRFETVAREYPNLGMDYKVSYFLQQTKKHLDEQKKDQG
jgi:outer membrane protein assembly factor BamD